jgi:very-short-patch-repair endonuclease
MLACMATASRIPRQLRVAPFSVAEARHHGLSPRALSGRAWRRIGSELYCWRKLDPEPLAVLAAWKRTLPPQAVFAGKTAAWILGLDFEPTGPVEIVVPTTTALRGCFGLKVRRCDVGSREIRTVKGLPTTVLHRTLRDLCAKWPPLEALVAIDMALHRRLTDEADLMRYAAGATGGHGTPRLRSLAKLAAPAESPMETRLRWLLLAARLPRPEVQVDLHDAMLGFVGRADLFYRVARLVIEFDGGNHRERLVDDDRRQNRLIEAGFKVLRFTTADVYQRPEVVVAQVRGAIGGFGTKTPTGPEGTRGFGAKSTRRRS